MTERTFTIHREGIDRFTSIVDGEEVVAVRAADYDAMETARDMLGRELDEAEAELAHIKRFLNPTGWQKAQDEHNALRARLAEAERDAERLDWIEANLIEGKWDGTIGRPKSWHMVGPYRHTLQSMRGNTLREAIDAHLSRKEGET